MIFTMMNKILEFFGIYTDSMKLGGVARSPLWGKTKKEFEKLHPKVCAVCGNKKVQLHHVQSFASHPELELDFNNLRWLCEGFGTKQHHIEFGHLGNFKSINKNLDEWINNYNNRPLWDGTQWK